MNHIIPDLLVVMQDLQNLNSRKIKTAIEDMHPEDVRLMTQQVRRLYQLLDIKNQITYGTRVEGGYVAGTKYRNASLREVLVIGPDCNEWRPIEAVVQLKD